MELLVVISILAILMAVTVPRIALHPARDAEDEVVRWIEQAVQRLSEQAMENQRWNALVLDLTRQQIRLDHGNASARQASSARQFQMPGDLTLMDVRFADGRFFDAGEVPIFVSPQPSIDAATIRFRKTSGKIRAIRLRPFRLDVKYVPQPIRG